MSRDTTELAGYVFRFGACAKSRGPNYGAVEARWK